MRRGGNHLPRCHFLLCRAVGGEGRRWPLGIDCRRRRHRRALIRLRREAEMGREGCRHRRVTYVELFFDLVFVFAITQISHSMLAHFTPLGILQTTILMLAVWWVWVFTAWITNWLDPDRTPVRVMLFGLMLAGLLLSTSIPKAFESRGIAFALAYVAMQVGRSAFFLFTLPKSENGHRLNFSRILVWMCVSGVFWISGGLVDGQARLALWVIALGIEYAGPAMRFWTPGLGASKTTDWVVEGGHMAEGAAGFVITRLGEAVCVT